MSDQPRTRQELYDRIRTSSKDEFVLEDMVRLGFWPAQGEIPEDPTNEFRERSEIQRELNALRTEKARLQNHAAMLRELRKRRLQESKQKQQATKVRREQERLERAAAWQQRKQQDLLYLGENVSAGLKHTESNAERLTQRGLPFFDTPLQLAEAMNISLGQLRFLAFNRDVSKVSHYVRFTLPKKTGGQRLISAPMPRLKQAQYWILENILKLLPVHETAQGFCPKRSIVSNAQPHVQQAVVINLDLKDFFPSIEYKRIKGLFGSFGYSEAIATVLALLCTEADTETVELDGERYYVAVDSRFLPQGAPTSPALTNLLCYKLDCRLNGLAKKLGFNYSRYADDLSFSSAETENIGHILRFTGRIVSAEGFALNPDKTRVMRKTQHQEVTGIVVNDKLSISRKELKRFRALLYQIEQHGLAGKHWKGKCEQQDLLCSIQGFANYVAMVDPSKGGLLKQRVRAIKEAL